MLSVAPEPSSTLASRHRRQSPRFATPEIILPAFLPPRSSPPPQLARTKPVHAPRSSVHHKRAPALSVGRAVLPLILLLLASGALYYLAQWGLMNRKSAEFSRRDYEYQPYLPLDYSVPVSTQRLKILHVTKEFGPATMGGLGVMLTSLSIAQVESESSDLDVKIVLPYYSFLDSEAIEMEKVTDLEVEIRRRWYWIGRERIEVVKCGVFKMRWEYSASTSKVGGLDVPREKKEIVIYLIGRGDKSPFNVGFRAKDASDIYSAYKPLKQEWKDLWFGKAAAQLIVYLNEEEGGGVPGVDIVHLHGATNAMVAFFLRQFEASTFPSSSNSHLPTPAIIYTLHDSLDEVEYSNKVSNLPPFVSSSPLSSSSSVPSSSSYTILASRFSNLDSYIHSSQLFTSSIGIDLSDMVTFVSKTVARDIVEGRFKFGRMGLVMSSIENRARLGEFLGVSNGIDLGGRGERARNPWLSEVLVNLGLNWDDNDTIGGPIHPFTAKKTEAKRSLVRQFPELFSGEDDELSRPWFLFVGRFQYNKGCQFFVSLLELLSSTTSMNGRLIVLGSPNNYPLSNLETLSKTYPDHFTLLSSSSSSSFQQEFGPLLRLASDFAFVPSFSEAFGLVAVEGMLFGQRVLSTGVGGLQEFLTQRSTTTIKVREEDGLADVEEEGNAYLFELFRSDGGSDDDEVADEESDEQVEARWKKAGMDTRMEGKRLEPARKACVESAAEGIREWNQLIAEGSQERREVEIRKLVSLARELEWNRERGPVEDYTRVYVRALGVRSTRAAVRNAKALRNSEDLMDESALKRALLSLKEKEIQV